MICSIYTYVCVRVCNVNVEVKWSLRLINYWQDSEGVWDSREISPAFLSSAPVGSE
jgi:hypothetical protein